MRNLIDIVESTSDPTGIIRKARQAGFNGWGGLCGEAAIAINRVVFNGEGTLVGAFNEALYEHRLVGHVAVLINGVYWDADGRPKSEDEIESWGMLDINDPDWAQTAEEMGIEWNDVAASTVALFECSEQEIIDIFGDDHLDDMIHLLEQKSCFGCAGLESDYERTEEDED